MKPITLKEVENYYNSIIEEAREKDIESINAIIKNNFEEIKNLTRTSFSFDAKSNKENIAKIIFSYQDFIISLYPGKITIKIKYDEVLIINDKTM